MTSMISIISYAISPSAKIHFQGDFHPIPLIWGHHLQTFLEHCSNTTDDAKIDFSILSFDSILRGVLDGTSRQTFLRQSAPSSSTFDSPKKKKSKSLAITTS